MIVNAGIPQHKCFQFCFLELCKSLPRNVYATAYMHYKGFNVREYLSTSSFYRHSKAIKNHTGVDIKKDVISWGYESTKNHEF